MSMRVLVAGGGGFIGVNLCAALATDPHVEEIVVVDLPESRDRDLPEPVDGVSIIDGDATDASTVDELMDGIDAVVNLVDVGDGPWAGADPDRTHRTVVGAATTLADAAATHGAHLVVASSSAVYGATPTRPAHEELTPNPLTPAARAFAEAETRVLGQAGLDSLALRLFDVFGPWRPAGHPWGRLVHDGLHAALRGEPLVVADRHDRIETAPARFVVDAIVHSLTWRITSDHPVNLATGQRISAQDLALMVEKVTGEPVEIHEHGGWSLRSHIASTRSFVRTFGPIEVPSLEREIAATWDWMRVHDPLRITLAS